MTLGTTSRVSVQYKPETVFGVTPAAGANFYDLRVTGESLDFALTKTNSAEINSTRSISSQVATSAAASGGVQAEFSHGEYDRFFAATLQDVWSTTVGTNGVLPIGSTSTTVAPTTITVSPLVASLANLQRGQWFRLTGGSGANNNRLFRVSKTTAPTTTVITLDAGTPGTVGGEGAGCSIQTQRLTHGTTQSSFSMQRLMNDMSPLEYFVYRGMTPSKLSFKAASGSLSSISFDFMGKDGVRFSGANNPLSKGIVAATGALDSGTSTLSPSLTAPIHAGTTSTNCVIWAGGVPLTGTYVKSIGFDYDNALRTQEAVCNLGSVGIGSGTINCMINMQLYFAEGAKFYTEFLANTNQEIAFSSADSDGNLYVFTMPNASVSTYKVNAGGKDADLLVDVTFTALRDAGNAVTALQKVMFIDRCGIAVAP